MAPPDYRAIYGCFDDYEACLCRLDPQYTRPGRKARIYAYCEAVGAATGPDKNYSDAKHWNADAPVLKPLQQLLRSMVGNAEA